MKLPLAGKRVLVTRPRHQAGGMVRCLESLGAIAIRMPAIEIAPLEDYSLFDDSLRRLPTYDWIVLTSVNGVQAVETRLGALGLARNLVTDRSIAVIGPATAHAVREAFREPDVMPAEYVAEAIAEALGNVAGLRFLLTRADIARPALADILRSRGAAVDEVAAYRIVAPETPEPIPSVCPDYVTLTSSASATATLEALEGRGHRDWLDKAVLACIGPVTAETVGQLGFSPAIQPAEYTVAALIEAIVAHAQSPERVLA